MDGEGIANNDNPGRRKLLVRVLVKSGCVKLIPDDDATGMAMTRMSILEQRRQQQQQHGEEEVMLMRKEVMMKMTTGITAPHSSLGS